eukprot:7081019-Pyramimonas_sp.AAC.1
MVYSGAPEASWQTERLEIAQDWRRWRGMIAKWRKDALKLASKDEWAERHSPEGAATVRHARRREREEMVQNIPIDTEGR